MNVYLYWNNYKYFPYEKELALKEIEALLNPKEINIKNDIVHVVLSGSADFIEDKFRSLTYFSKIEIDGKIIVPYQVHLEQSVGNLLNNRQSTRYSAHGIHEYKGKFNPQVVKALLNIFKIKENNNVVDPFSGSGTTILECSFQNINGIGLDINPLAIFIANAKQTAISTPVETISSVGKSIIGEFHKSREFFEIPSNPTVREEYLLKWLPEDSFCDLEVLRKVIADIAGPLKDVFYVLLSDQVRDYSLQEPADLRIRKRKSPFPEEILINAYENSINKFVENIRASQEVTGLKVKKNVALRYDSRVQGMQKEVLEFNYFDAGITSPPYATALPYIDTQRISLVWLGLIPPSEILSLEAQLIGSREFKASIKKEWTEKMITNESKIPNSLYNYCLELQNSLSETDGFRRQAVPLLLYRYFADMLLMFRNLLPHFKHNAPYALIVGHNHTTLGGKRFDIDTPSLLVEIATQVGWLHEESIELQTYKRYGIHQKNAVNNETLIILRK